MSPFIFVATLVSVIFWAVWLYTLIMLPPNNKALSIFFFLASFFFALATSLTIVFYRLALRGAGVHPRYLNSNLLMRHCLRRAGLIAGALTVSASLKVLEALTLFNFFLLILIAFFAELYLSRRR